MGSDGRGVFLKIVGRQPVVLGPDEGFEEPPRATRYEPREFRRLPGSKLHASIARRLLTE
jgi:hypothetical protein